MAPFSAVAIEHPQEIWDEEQGGGPVDAARGGDRGDQAEIERDDDDEADDRVVGAEERRNDQAKMWRRAGRPGA